MPRSRRRSAPSRLDVAESDDRGHATTPRAMPGDLVRWSAAGPATAALATAIVAGARALRIAASDASMVCLGEGVHPERQGAVDRTKEQERPPVAGDGAQSACHGRRTPGARPPDRPARRRRPTARARARRRACTGRTRRTWRRGSTRIRNWREVIPTRLGVGQRAGDGRQPQQEHGRMTMAVRTVPDTRKRPKEPSITRWSRRCKHLRDH